MYMYMYMGSNTEDEGAYSGMVYNVLAANGYPLDRIVADKYDDGLHYLRYWRNIYPEFPEAMSDHSA